MASTFFPSTAQTDAAANNGLDEDKEEENATEATTEILSQLPDAPTDEPVTVDDVEEPLQKKQKTEEVSDDDFVLVEKEGTDETKSKVEF